LKTKSVNLWPWMVWQKTRFWFWIWFVYFSELTGQRGKHYKVCELEKKNVSHELYSVILCFGFSISVFYFKKLLSNLLILISFWIQYYGNSFLIAGCLVYKMFMNSVLVSKCSISFFFIAGCLILKLIIIIKCLDWLQGWLSWSLNC